MKFFVAGGVLISVPVVVGVWLLMVPSVLAWVLVVSVVVLTLILMAALLFAGALLIQEGRERGSRLFRVVDEDGVGFGSGMTYSEAVAAWKADGRRGKVERWVAHREEWDLEKEAVKG